MSKIEWTGKTWNPVIGCTEVSRGCMNCYAAKMAYRLMHIPAMADTYAGIAKRLDNGRIVFTGKVKELPERLNEPFMVKKPTTWFVNSMSDLFHPDVTFNFIYKVFEMMYTCKQHTFQVLTKQASNMEKMLDDVYLHLWRNYPELKGKPIPNVWLGVSTENQKAFDLRVPPLLRTVAAVRFISYEPAVGPIDLSVTLGLYEYDVNKWACKVGSSWANTIDWVICGGESGTGKNITAMKPEWAQTVRDQCKAAGVPFFFKQWGNWHPTERHDGERVIGNEYGRFDGDKFLPGNWVVTSFPPGTVYMVNVGKHIAGNLLDGVTHLEYPKTHINDTIL